MNNKFSFTKTILVFTVVVAVSFSALWIGVEFLGGHPDTKYFGLDMNHLYDQEYYPD